MINTWAGYVEEVSIDVAAEVGGKLEKVFVVKGQSVDLNAPLFVLDNNPERIQLDEALAHIAAQQQHILEAEAQFKLAEQTLKRAERLAKSNISSQSDLDATRAKRSETFARYQASKEELKALESGRQLLLWILSRKQQNASSAGTIEDIWYEVGDLIAAGKPILRLRPEHGITLRFFVPESKLATLTLGSIVQVSADGVSQFSAVVTGIASEPEFTPPILYTEGSRSKMLFWVEAKPELETKTKLHPGLPIDVFIP